MIKKFLYIFAIAAFAISCGGTDYEPVDPDLPDDSDDQNTEEVVTPDLPDTDTDTDDCVENLTFGSILSIAFSNSGVEVSGSVDSVAVTTSGSDVTIVSTAHNVDYRLSGSTTDGSLKIYSDNRYRLSLNSVSIANSDGAALNLQSKKRAFIVAAAGSVNSFSDGSSYASSGNEDMKGTIFGEGELIFSGSGRVTVTGNAKHAICSDQYVRIRSGANIVVASAAKDGIHANDAVYIDDGTIEVNASSDGIECEEGFVEIAGGTITVNSVDDGIVTSYEGDDTSVNPYIIVRDGTLTLNTSAQKGMAVKSAANLYVAGGLITAKVTGAGSKCFKVAGDLSIESGTIDLTTTGSAYYDSTEADITSPACINADGSVIVTDGTITLSSSGQAGKGITCDGDFAIKGGTLNVTTTGKQYVYNRLDSSAKGIKSSSNVTIDGGELTISTTGGEGSEALESKNVLTINNGTIVIRAYDDCINASKQIVINGGRTYAYSTNNDGIDSNGTLTVTGGLVIASGTTSPEEGFDCDQNTFKITGGTLIGFGGATSTPSASVSTQRSVVYGTSGTQGRLIAIQDSSSNTIVTFVTPRTYSQMTLLFSSPDLKADTSYKILTGGSVAEGTLWNGYYSAGTYSGGTQATTFTTSSMVTSVGSTSGGGGGGPGGRP